MKILVIRHGIARDREAHARKGLDDAERALTRAGKKRMRRISRGLHRLVPDINVLASSPLLRAVQTAHLVAARYEGLESEPIAALSPRKSRSALLAWLEHQPPDGTIALVGHEPHLGAFVSWMLTGLQDSFITLKKGGACLIEIKGELKPGRAQLLWLAKPSQLRQ